MTTKKHMMRYFSMAALVLAVATMVGCTKDEIGDTVTFTTTVEMPGGSKALDGLGHKTFAVGDQITVTYDSGKEAISEPLTEEDIDKTSRKSARFTFTLSSPTLSEGSTIKYEYPAAHNGLDGQDGSLATLAARYDYAKWEGTVTSEGHLPGNIQLANQYAILKLILKTSSESDITSDIRQLIVKSDRNTVMVNCTTALDTIYVAIDTVSNSNFVFEAAKGKDLYKNSNTISGRTLRAGHLYFIKVNMLECYGTLSGLFSVNASGKKVRFSKSNLRAVFASGSSKEWRITTNQYDYVGNAAANTIITGNGSISATGSVDLFGWNTNNTDNGINNSTDNSTYSGDFKEWGTQPTPILYNSHESPSGWFTLNKDEWEYLIGHHYKGMATINDIPGIVILPDYWRLPAGCSFTNFSDGGSSYTSNTYTTDQWASMEAAGAVFLPAAGKREGSTVTTSDGDNGYIGYYWSATPQNTSSAYCFSFWNNGLFSGQTEGRHFGHSVRLVRRQTL